MKSTIILSGLIYILQIVQIPSGCSGELLEINVQNQVISAVTIRVICLALHGETTKFYRQPQLKDSSVGGNVPARQAAQNVSELGAINEIKNLHNKE
jgi:hypothetical protein